MGVPITLFSDTPLGGFRWKSSGRPGENPFRVFRGVSCFTRARRDGPWPSASTSEFCQTASESVVISQSPA
eukprot:2935093-Pyramimonas_sp.AAC.1